MLGLNDATTNGSQLSSTAIGTQQAAMAPIGTQPVGGAVQGVDVTATSGVNPVGQNQGNFFRNGDGSFHTGDLQLVLGWIQTLGSLWNSYQQHKIAKEQLVWPVRRLKPTFGTTHGLTIQLWKIVSVLVITLKAVLLLKLTHIWLKIACEE